MFFPRRGGNKLITSENDSIASSDIFTLETDCHSDLSEQLRITAVTHDEELKKTKKKSLKNSIC